MIKRIFIAALGTETNQFVPFPTGLRGYQEHGVWRGDATRHEPTNFTAPLHVWRKAIEARGWTAIEGLATFAAPSGTTVRSVYEGFRDEILDGIEAALPLDGVLINVHGAMVADGYDDCEGDLLSKVRAIVGPKVPVAVSLDLHSNTTPAMFANSELLVAYRTYPHIDMAETGARAAFYLKQRIGGMAAPKVAWRVLPYLIPITAQCTDLFPGNDIYTLVGQLESNDVPSASFTPGFPAADFDGCAPVVWAYGVNDAAAADAASKLERRVLAAEGEWDARVLSAVEAVREAQLIASTARKPVVIADTQDNPGAGGDSDTMGMVRALLECRAERAATGLIVDGAAAKAAHEVGVGKTLNFALGGKSRIPGDSPLELPWTVEALHEGNFAATGPFYRGMKMRLGPSACLRYQGVRIVVATYKTQLADQAMYRYVGIEPTEQAILVNKSSVHFRADFTPIAEKILVAKAPGPMAADPADLPWRHLPRGIRLHPFGKPFA